MTIVRDRSVQAVENSPIPEGSDSGEKARKRRRRTTSPKRGTVSKPSDMGDNAIRIDVYLAVTLFAVAVGLIKNLPTY